MSRILITGASGFIGSHSVQAFRQIGWQVVGLGRRPLPDPDYIQADLSRPLSLSTIDRIGKVDVILHAAARSSPWGSKKQFHSANVLATQRLLDFASQADHPKFLFVSSSSVYYQPKDQLDITELTPQAPQPVNFYAATKQLAEQLVRNYSGTWCILRPRAVYGIGDTVLFPRILAAAQAGRLPLLIRDGSPAIGDLVSIDNLLHYFVKAASDDGIAGEFNLTDNQSVPILDFLLNIFERLGIPKPKKRIHVRTAFRAARALETLYAIAVPWKEPPITRFGVHVFAYSKTFDVQKMLNCFGQPAKTVDQSVDSFVNWVRTSEPYGNRT